MRFIRVSCYDGKERVGDHLFLDDSQANALQRFRKSYPEMDKCVLVAETVELDDPISNEWFMAYWRTGCFH